LSRNNPEEPIGIFLRVQEFKGKDLGFLDLEKGNGNVPETSVRN